MDVDAYSLVAPPAAPQPPSKSQSSGSDNGSKSEYISMKTSLKHKFYGPLALLLALEPEEGHPVNPAPSSEFIQPSLLRNFLDAVCYICDRDKGDGHTTTAAALEQRGEQVVIVLAADGGVKEITCDLLTRILDLCFIQVKAGEPAVTKKILAMVIVHSMPRLKKYEKLTEAQLRACSKEISKSAGMASPKVLGKYLFNNSQICAITGAIWKSFTGSIVFWSRLH